MASLHHSVVLISVLALLAHTQGGTLIHRASGVPLPDYDCTGKEDGYYPHPEKCSAYVLCTESRSAYEMECTEGGLDEFGQSIQLHFVAESGPNMDTARCDEPSVSRCRPDPPTTPPTTTTTTLATTPAPKSCKLDCQLIGYCRDYSKCEPDTPNAITGPGHLVNLTCAEDLFWNPENSPIHGGTCDYYDSLSDAIKNEYRNDRDCIEPCDWFQTDDQKCSAEYTYREEFTGSTKNRETVLWCPSPPAGKDALYWSNARKTCVKCSDADFQKETNCTCK